MIKALIFDLDNCLFETRSMGNKLLEPLLAVLREAVSSGEMSKALADEITEVFWTTSLADIIEHYSLSRQLHVKLETAYKDLQVPDGVKLFDDVEVLPELKPLKILVTSGQLGFQESKLAKLGVAKYFAEVILDNTDSGHPRVGKTQIFRDIMQKYGFGPRECLVIGDNPVSELKSGKELGMITIQTLRPRVIQVAGYDHYITSLHGLPEIISSYEKR